MVPQYDNGEAFAIARQLRGLTQREAAERLNFSQATISKIELGIQAPSEEQVIQLAELYSVRPSFFSMKIRSMPPGLKYHRKRKQVPAKALGIFDATLVVLRVQVERLLSLIELIDSKQRRFDPSRYSSPVVCAQAVRQFMATSRGPIRNLTDFVEDFGFIVLSVSIPSRQIDGVTFELSQDTAPPIIVLNRDMPTDRYRFTLAHELGHALMHINKPFSENQEKEANEFASELLMPASDIRQQLLDQRLSLERLMDLKRFWRVSIQSLIERAYRLSVISSSDRQRLYATLSRYGYRTKEPIELEAEAPTLSKELIETCLELGYINDDFCDFMGLSRREEIFDLYNVPRTNHKMRPKIIQLINQA